MSRKVFISFLGTTDYFPSMYYRGKKFCSEMEKYVQAAALQYVQRNKPWTDKDIAYILLTELAEKRNWCDNGYTDRNGKPNIGLQSVISSKNFPFPCQPIPNIPEGKNEGEIWRIFKIIHDLIQSGDELYFDITHGYRYLPMLVVVLGNYSKFLEKAKVVHILYGNYEGRDRDENGNYINPPHAPLVDLQSFSTLQDWTYAVADFINNGNADRMADLTYGVSAPLIKKGQERAGALNRLVTSIKAFAKDMQTCRARNIVSGLNIMELKQNLSEIDEILHHDDTELSVDQLLIPVFEKIREVVERYDDNEDITNGFKAVEWCLEHGLYQQAITILQESVKSYFCQELRYDIYDADSRENIKALLDVAKYKGEAMIPVEIGQPRGATEWAKTMKAIAQDYDSLRKLRNDINHAGLSFQPAEASFIEETIKEKYASIKEILGVCSSI